MFLIGAFKLWLSNRQIQKHEVIDEERRARVAEMNYCGIRHLNHTSIPFGARAIEHGEEVEGIWNSSRGVSDTSQVASSPALGTDDNDRVLPRGGIIYSDLQDNMETPARSSGSTVTHSSAPSSTYHDCRSTGHPDDDDVDDSAIRSVQEDGDLRTNRLLDTDRAPLQGPIPVPTLSPPNTFANRTRTRASSSSLETTSQAYLVGRAYGSAQVYANTERRNMNSGFEILPAGTLGARLEFSKSSPSSATSGPEPTIQRPHKPAKFRKQNHLTCHEANV